jgi:hypothetical protein
MHDHPNNILNHMAARVIATSMLDIL